MKNSSDCCLHLNIMVVNWFLFVGLKALKSCVGKQICSNFSFYFWGSSSKQDVFVFLKGNVAVEFFVIIRCAFHSAQLKGVAAKLSEGYTRVWTMKPKLSAGPHTTRDRSESMFRYKRTNSLMVDSILWPLGSEGGSDREVQWQKSKTRSLWNECHLQLFQINKIHYVHTVSVLQCNSLLTCIL